ncbi:sugar ABC transporter ATP-binding protein [Ensifer adhaerens]|uniref:sugar ABC transporter ATP-binding protein n=1 Tax=Ensifer adhaerens TaxID=106592 RepID=UPI001CC1BB10|nr:sugar ABC transporter ATP-binding protein [Ensifer adhaerens]MBZ7924183.1 sugar ABC transporter ATP-binding protein [Ensifer adhaerens]UAX96559.1 sugar ABC transporter ATP-binding protein [Ensifer adhaerens]UAY04097.1 sugar ABC transporter ATP-binding protein [Ensifer adhaerens]UAY12083.1 sugar ABC transporter ATP-binding protein [Ensifer adhaerens]
MVDSVEDRKHTLALAGIRKAFPGVVALDNVDLTLYPGEIHALLGENGAGKSTLIKVLTGAHIADEGTMWLAGSQVHFKSPKDAIRAGVKVVPQDIFMVPELSIGRNILLGMERRFASKGRLSAEEANLVADALSRAGASFSPHVKTAALTVPQRRLAQIARALLQPGDVMILDEPTAVLSEPDADHLLSRLEHFRNEGKTILYVTHRLSEVMRMADRITILRDGKGVGTFSRGEISREEIVTRMAKEGAVAAPVKALPRRTQEQADAALQTENLTSSSHFSGVTFSVKPGEIVGVAGVQGSGHGALMRALAGAEKFDGGMLVVEGKPVSHFSSRRAVRAGVLFVPSDRRGSAIVPSLSIKSNIALSARVRADARRFGLRWHSKECDLADSYVASMSIRPANIDAPIGSLSGGNQQKVVIARALEAKARVLLVEEPTQGVDVGAKAEIHTLLREAAYTNGCAVLIATSEFEELLGLADTIHVMRSGRIVQTIPGTDATYKSILEYALP